MKLSFNIIIVFAALILGSCNEKYTPKPRGYFRINFPEKNYQLITENLPYKFEIPTYSIITNDRYSPDSTNWINVTVPENKAEIHISYYSLKKQLKPARDFLNELMEETHTLAYKHVLKADGIREKVYMNPENNVFGLVYRIEGNAASPLQFFLTDSTTNFIRGAFYINEVPNIDSIKPVIDFLETDIIHLIETTTWN